MLKRCLLFTENTYFFLSESACVKLWVWRRHANDFVFRELWSNIILWCLQSKVPKCSHPNKLLTSVLLDTLLISLMASGLKRAEHIFRTSMNMWWKTLHVCLSNVKVGFRRDFIPAQTLVKFNFLHSKRFFRNSVVLKLWFQAFCVWYANEIEWLQN